MPVWFSPATKTSLHLSNDSNTTQSYPQCSSLPRKSSNECMASVCTTYIATWRSTSLQPLARFAKACYWPPFSVWRSKWAPRTTYWNICRSMSNSISLAWRFQALLNKAYASRKPKFSSSFKVLVAPPTIRSALTLPISSLTPAKLEHWAPALAASSRPRACMIRQPLKMRFQDSMMQLS